jgi:hypothetical protein
MDKQKHKGHEMGAFKVYMEDGLLTAFKKHCIDKKVSGSLFIAELLKKELKYKKDN